MPFCVPLAEMVGVALGCWNLTAVALEAEVAMCALVIGKDFSESPSAA